MVTYACRIVCWGLPTACGAGHHAPDIRLGDLDAFIKLSLQSHRHLRTYIIDSTVGEFATVLLTRSFVMAPNSFLAWVSRSLISSVSLRSGTK
jgi:hypothetical protein